MAELGPTQISDPPVDGTVELACPLCGYNLRGLTEPRCPECGFAFTWAELLDAKRDRHPWLFEHGRGRNVRAFVATYGRTPFARRFWLSVTPSNPVHLGRLALYWLLVSLPLATALLWSVPGQLARRAADVAADRAIYLPALAAHPFVYLPRTGYRGPLTAAALDAEYPVPWSPAFFVLAWERADLTEDAGAVAAAVAVPLAWPWLTAAALLLFQPSMRRARVRPAHVLRVAVYGCDFGLLLAAVAAVAFVAALSFASAWQWELYRATGLQTDSAAVLAVIATAAGIAAYRTGRAYRSYLRFHWPVPTVLAAQAVVVFAVLAIEARWLVNHR
jgi:hypothetical protein